MNKIFKTASLIAGSLLIAMVSCKKATEVTPVEALGSATIKGQLFYDADETSDDDDNNDDVPTGAVIRYTYDNAITGDTESGSTTVDGSGNFSFTVPTDADGVDVEITADDFVGTLKFVDPDDSDDDITEAGFYEGIDFDDEFVVSGQTVIISRDYLGDFSSTANPSFYDGGDK